MPSVVPPTFTGVTDYFSADLGIEVTPEARIELVLDEVLGDIIRAQGSGSMRLKILEDESVELLRCLYCSRRGLPFHPSKHH